jgi:peptide/nickel transport system permease protein
VYFLFRRIGFYLVTLWAALTLNFLIPRLMPGDPINALIQGLSGTNSQAAVEQMRERFGLSGHQSLASQYAHYWSQLAHGDLGTSIKYYPEPVSKVIGGGLFWTVGLVGVATVISFVLGTALGVVTAWKRGSKLDALLPAVTFFSAVPYFWIALVVLVLFGVELQWLPLAGGYDSDLVPGLNGEFVGNVISHALLPALTIVVSSLAGWFLGMRNMMVTTLSEDYVLVAEAKGLPTRRRMLAYAARNAILPNIAAFALSLGFIVSGALLTELVFSYPGIGFVLYNGVLAKDLPLMQGVFLIITILVLAANLLADVVYVFLDPRTRQEN